MVVAPLVVRARQVWVNLAEAPIAFPATGGVTVVVSPTSRLCPRSWVGVVVLGDAAIATASDQHTAAIVRAVFAGLPVASLTDVDRLREGLPVVAALGPATLAYTDTRDFCPTNGAGIVEALPAGHRDLAALMACVDEEEAGESGIDEVTSPVFVVREEDNVVVAAGYRQWPGSVAHLCVLTSPRHRGRGLARGAASAAVADALGSDLLPQWRAGPPDASRRVARALGFHEVGAQLSLRLET
jgi:hypothetical protein